MIPPKFDIWLVAIPVKDLDISTKFYSDLGFMLIGTDESPSKKQAFVATRPGGFTIELFQPRPISSEARLPDHLAFDCENIGAFRESLTGKFGDDLPQVEEFDNGVSYLGLKDPSGVAIQFFQGRHIYEQSISRN